MKKLKVSDQHTQNLIQICGIIKVSVFCSTVDEDSFGLKRNQTLDEYV